MNPDAHPKMWKWRWLAYFLIPWTFLYLVFLGANSYTSSDFVRESMEEILWIVSFVMTAIIVCGARIMSLPFTEHPGDARRRTRDKCSQLCGIALVLSIFLSLGFPVGGIYGGMESFLMVLGIFLIIVFLALFSAIELVIAKHKYENNRGWEWDIVETIALALFAPPLVVAVIAFLLWVLSRMTAF